MLPMNRDEAFNIEQEMLLEINIEALNLPDLRQIDVEVIQFDIDLCSQSINQSTQSINLIYNQSKPLTPTAYPPSTPSLDTAYSSINTINRPHN